MALDLETIHDSYHQGYGEWVPQGLVGSGMKGYNNPFETWPAEVQKTYSYDPEGAEKLLDEAGYPRGADGIRFKTNLYTNRASSDTGYRELAAGYWSKIGVEVEVNAIDDTQYGQSRAGTNCSKGLWISRTSGPTTGILASSLVFEDWWLEPWRHQRPGL